MKQNFTTKEIIERVSDATGFNKADVKTIIDLTVALVNAELLNGKQVRVERLGIFETTERKERHTIMGVIPPHVVVKFRASASIKKSVK
jgi:nucleoid DNA-binding protein